jgi:antitoxin component of MazEF toxin-antitoxin module
MMKLQTKLRKSGNAQVIPVPAAALTELGVELGTEFTMVVSNGKIELEKVKRRLTEEEFFKRLATADLSIPEDTRIFEEAPPVGREVI